MKHTVRCRYTTDVGYYKDMAQWLRDVGITKWLWDDGNYTVTFDNEMDALTFKLR